MTAFENIEWRLRVRLPALKQIDRARLNGAQLPFGREGPVSVIKPPFIAAK